MVIVAVPEADSLEETFRANYGRLVATLSFGADMQSAEDAVQEAFVKASAHWDRVRRYDKPVAWVRRVALHLLLNKRRDRDRRRAAEQAASVDVRGEPLDLGQDLDDAIAALPPRQRLYVVLYYVEGMSVTEIADAAAVKEGSVKSGLHDARSKLFERLETEYGS